MTEDSVIHYLIWLKAVNILLIYISNFLSRFDIASPMAVATDVANLLINMLWMVLPDNEIRQ